MAGRGIDALGEGGYTVHKKALLINGQPGNCEKITAVFRLGAVIFYVVNQLYDKYRESDHQHKRFIYRHRPHPLPGVVANRLPLWQRLRVFYLHAQGVSTFYRLLFSFQKSRWIMFPSSL